jgi:hypothetical protein
LCGCPVHQLRQRVDFHAGIIQRHPRVWKPVPRRRKPKP